MPDDGATTPPAHEPLTARHGLDPGRMPGHVAIIMDGNGRWAGERGLPRNAGHQAGEHALFDTVEGALDLGVRWLTVYAFSTENWRRPPSEVRFIMNFNRDLLLRRADELDERQVRVRFIGRKVRPIPASLRRLMVDTEERTAHHRRLTLQIAFNYGSRAEIADATRALATQVAEGRLDPRKITERTVQRQLYTREAPDVDLLIRTSGEQRISNYLLWQAAYAELVFSEVYWPDFDRKHLTDAIAEFQHRARRFGRV
ncbi:MAG TPA: polyprenyl diphosphate synthase [Euzebyales bacterium]|nr:polyprenyl diphosphate synthase [Euzebyales bacterium]